MFQKIKQIFSKINFLGKNKTYSFSPKRDWAIIVSLFFVANMVLITLLTVNYLKIINESTSEASGGFEKIEPIDERDLQVALDIFLQREGRYQVLLENKPKTLDPSI